MTLSRLCLLLLLVVGSKSGLLLLDTLLSALAGGLGLGTLGVHLLLELGLTGLLGLSLMDLSNMLEESGYAKVGRAGRTCSTRARLCLKVLPLLRW